MKTTTSIFVGFLILEIGLAQVVHAQTNTCDLPALQHGIQIVEKTGSYVNAGQAADAKAVHLLTPSANAGCQLAQDFVMLAYEDIEAAESYRMGSVDSATTRQGKLDYARYRKLAEEGNAAAEAYLSFYYSGDVDVKNWARKAVAQNDYAGFISLAWATQDLVEKYALYSMAGLVRASVTGHPKGDQALQEFVNSHMTHKDGWPTTAQISAGEVLVRQMQQKGVLQALDAREAQKTACGKFLEDIAAVLKAPSSHPNCDSLVWGVDTRDSPRGK